MNTTTAALPVEDATWHRLSPRMLLIHPVIEIGKAVPALIGLFFAGGAGGHGGYWSLVGAGVVAAWSLSRWFTTRLRITPQSVHLRQGLLRRKTITAARDRIRTVDVTSHLLHRLLGLARVVIGTGTNDRKGEGRIILDGLPVGDARTLRDALLHRRPPGAGAVPPTDAQEDHPAGPGQCELARLDRRWIRYAPFTLSGVLTGLVIWGFYWRIQGESGIDLARSGPLHAVSQWLGRLPMSALVLAVVVAIVLFVTVTSTIGYVLAFWNFRLVRHDGGTLQVTRGLITSRATSIEARRLVGTQISEPLLLRCVGAARTLVIATGLRVGRGAERGGEVLLPPAPVAEAVAVAALVLDGTPAVTAPLRTHPRAALRRHVTRALAGGLVVFGATGVFWWAGAPLWVPVVGIALLAVSLPLGVDRYRSLGHTLTDGFVVSRVGSLVRRRSVVADEAIIGWNLKSTYFQRRLGLMTLTATTAAGRQGYGIIDIDPHEAVALAQTVTPDLIAAFRRAPHRAHPTTSS